MLCNTIPIFTKTMTMSRVYEKAVPLEEMLKATSTMVLRVRKSAPFETEASIPFPDSQKPIPPFTYIVDHFVVLSVIHNINSWEVAVNDSIAVHCARFNSKIGNHKKYYERGLNKSVYRYYYESDVDIDNVEAVLIFIQPNWDTNHLEYFVNSAYHGIEDEATVRNLIKNKPTH